MVIGLKRSSWLIVLSLLLVSISFYLNGDVVYSSQNKTLNDRNNEIDLSEVTFIKSETERDIKLEEAFSKVFDLKRGEDKVHYYYNRVDLNNDNIPETFVYLTGPLLCGTGGCSGLIFTQADSEYKLLSRFSLVRTPVIISDTTTNGWKDIIMYVAGGGIKGGYKRLTFDGVTYPLNPSIQPDVKKGKIKGIGIISDDISKNKGIMF